MKKITVTIWRRFEKVVSLVIKNILENVTTAQIEEKLTEPTHDGGYDGSFIIPCITEKNHSESKGYYKILFEAKLRNNLDKDLPLQDFSKALIIAINMDSDALIVATNLRLSEGTKIHLRDFSDKTGLKTFYLSPYYIDHWMSENFSSKHKNTDIKIRELLKSASTYSDLETPLVALGNEPIKEHIERAPLLGKARHTLLKSILHALKQPKGMIVVKGNAGVGKSFFCNYLICELEKQLNCVYSIDLKTYSTPRVLFLKLLEVLWHIPFEVLLSFDANSLEHVIDKLDKQIVDDDVKEAILSAFSRDLEHYSQNADVLNYYLIKYLLIIYNIRSRHVRIILYFSNINSLSKEMTEFVLQFLNDFVKQGKVILELRTSLCIDTQMTSEDWEDYVKRITSMEQIIYQDVVEEFVPAEAYEFIRITLNLPNPTILLMDSILQVTGYNPLFIGSLVEYLNISGVLSLPQETILQRLAHLIVDDKRQIISMLIDAFCRKNNFYPEFFEAIRIFQIPINESYIARLINTYETEYIDKLIDANLLLRINDTLEIVHPLQFECILNSRSLTDSLRQKLAKDILNTLDQVRLASDNLAMTQIRCYRILHAHEMIIDTAYPLAMGLLESGQYTLCYEYALDALERIEVLDPRYKMLIHLKILLLMIEICIYMEEDTIEEIGNYMEKLNYAVQRFQSSKETNEYTTFKAQYYMTKNRYEHFMGLFDEAFYTLADALKFANAHKKELEDQVIGNIQLEYAIALKEKEDLNSSLSYLKKCLKEQPDNPELLFTYHTQMYELHLLTNPELALKHTEHNRILCSHLSVATGFHNEVHWLNAQFYLRNYDICYWKAISVFEETEQRGLKNEAGRLANLLGNIYFQRNDFENAKKYYKYGIDLFQEKGYVSNLWSLLINISTLLTEMHDETVVPYLYSAIDILANSYWERIQKTYPLPGYYEKLQVAVVIIYYNTLKLNSFLPIEYAHNLQQYLSIKLLNDNFKTWLFALSCEEIIDILKETRHYHSPYLMLGN